MERPAKAPLCERIFAAASASLSEQGSVSPIDVIVCIGWLVPDAVKRWRQGQIDFLEDVA